MSDQQNQGKQVSLYQRLLARMEQLLESVEDRSWKAIQDRLEEAAKLELAAEDMTKDEIELLKAWVRRDIHSMATNAGSSREELKRWLQFDIELLEHRTADMLLSLADRSQLDMLELQHRLTLEDDVYVSGEVAAPGTFKCNECGHMHCMTEAGSIKPCHVCNNHYFVRITRQECAATHGLGRVWSAC